MRLGWQAREWHESVIGSAVAQNEGVIWIVNVPTIALTFNHITSALS